MCKFTRLLCVTMVLVLSSTLLFGQALKLDEQRALQMKQEALKSDIVPGVHALGDVQFTDFDYTKLASSDETKFVLYDNGPLITNPGGGAGGADLSALQTTLGMNTLGGGFQISAGNSIADDFEVTSTWNVTTITFYSYQSGAGSGTSTHNDVRFRIWDGDPTAGGSVIWGDLTTNRLVSSAWTNIYRATDTNPAASDRAIMDVIGDATGLVLTPGTYWIEVQVGGSASYSGPWCPPVTILGQTTTGNAKQNVTGAWGNWLDTGTSTGQGMPFMIEGNAGGLPDNDLSVNQIIEPTSGFNLTNAEPVTIKIQNLGNNAQSNFDVSFSVDGGAAVVETVSATIPSLESYDYTFAATADLSEYGDHTIVACTELVGDETPDNDCKEATVSNMQVAMVYPQSSDYWTGSTDGSTKTETSIVNCLGNVELGWMKFDISSIPTDATINSVKFHGYVSATYYPYWSITPLSMDPVTASAADLWTAISGATAQGVAYAYNNEASTFAPGWHEYTLGTTIIEDFTAALAQGWFAVGCADRDAGTTYYVIMDGWNETNVPWLEVNYSGGGVVPPECDVYFDDFESYTVGQQLVSQNSTDWTTWSNAPGSAEDPYIVDNGGNVVEITGTNDLVYVMENYTSGFYTVSFDMYVPTGGDGYFNTLQSFAGTASSWGMQVYFGINNPGEGNLDAGGALAQMFSFDYDTWMQIKVTVDLDNDWGEFYLDDVLIHGWVWSTGAFGTNSLNQLGGNNFYANPGVNANPLFHFDNYCLDTDIFVPLDPIENLVVTTGDCTVMLDWDEPGSGGGEGQWIYWDQQVNGDDGIGLTAGGTFLCASHWYPADLAPYDGMYITKMNLYKYDNAATATFILKVWTGANAGTEVMSQAVTSVIGWNEFDLTSPVMIDASQELWFGYEVTHPAGENPAGVDFGPAIQGYGDMISLDGVSWVSMGATYSLNYNWNLGAYVEETDDGKTLAQPLVKSTIEIPANASFAVASGFAGQNNKFNFNSNKALTGYNVWQDGVNIDYTTETEYTDTGVPTGSYQYCVTAVYDEGESDPVCESVDVQCSMVFDPPTNLTAETGNCTVMLDWDAPGGGPTGAILVVDRDGSFDGGYSDDWATIQAALDANGYTYDYFEVTDLTQNGPDLATMEQYDLIIWFSGEAWGYYGDDCMTGTDEANVADYLDGGGALLFSGMDYFYASYPSAGNFSAGQFPYDYLGVNSAVQDNWNVFNPDVASVTGLGAAAGLTFTMQDIYSAKDGLYIDKITHMGDDIFQITSPTPAGMCAVQYDAGIFKSIYTTGSLAAISDPDEAADVIGACVDWLMATDAKALTGYNIYQDGNMIDFTTETMYTDTNVPTGTYEYCVTAVYDEGESEPVCETVDVTCDTGPLDPPENLTAETGNCEVMLDWDEPGGGGEGEWIYWDQQVNGDDGIGLTAGGTFYVASHWYPADLTPYDGMYITKMNWYHYDNAVTATFVLKVWTGANAGTEIMSQTVSSTIGWNEVDLTSPVMIDASQELWFGYAVTHPTGENPAGVDFGPAIYGYGDMISLDGVSWVSMGTEYGLDYNWNLGAYVMAMTDGQGPAQPLVKSIVNPAPNGSFAVAGGVAGEFNKFTANAGKALNGYNIYQDGTLIDYTTQTMYTHSDVPTGTYEYCVTAVYDEGESDPVCITVEVECGVVPYCDASGGCDEYIDGVEFGDIVNLGTDCSEYADYTDLSTEVEPGMSYPLTLTTGTPYTSDDYGIWIDFNQDGDFYDTGENVVCEIDNGLASHTWDIAIPSDAMEGETRMRIRLKYSGSDCGDPCGTTTYGEVEDYTVVISGGVTPPECDVYFDDFESYTVGEQLVAQNPDDWTTWSNSPGSTEDPYIVDNGGNVVEITGVNDLVYVIDNYTSGFYTIMFDMYVPTGGDGYFNTLQDFAGTASSWGMQVYFGINNPGEGNLDAGGALAQMFSFDYDTWMQIKVTVDLDDDWGEFFLNGELIHGWVWSTGAFGTGNLNQLGGSNFYAYSGVNANPLFHMDNYCLDGEGDILPPPLNLALETNNSDVILTWDPPMMKASQPFGGFVTVEVPQNISYIVAADVDPSVTPMVNPETTFEVPVYASFDANKGILWDNGPLITTPGGGAGGADVSELQTGLGMNTLGGGFQISAANSIADDFEVVGDWEVNTITFFAYQSGAGSGTSTINDVRFQIWDGDPSAGGSVIWGDLTTNRLISSAWTNIYRATDSNPAASDRAIMDVVGDADGLMLTEGTYWIEVTVGGSASYSGPWCPPVTIVGQTSTGNSKQNVAGAWQDWLDTGTSTPQGMPFVIDGTGSGLNLLGYKVYHAYQSGAFALLGETTVTTYTHVEPDHGLHKYYVTAVYDAGESGPSNMVEIVITGLDESVFNNTVVYPNPATNAVNISTDLTIRAITVYNFAGQVMLNKEYNDQFIRINTSSYQSGVYFLQIRTDEGMITKRLIIE